MDAKLLNPSVLAFVGDSVYSLLVREKFAEINRKSGDLHSLSVKLVNASAQAKAYAIIEQKLTEEELEQVTGGNIEQEIKNLAKQHFQIEEEGSGEKFKDFLEKYARYYRNILPKK